MKGEGYSPHKRRHKEELGTGKTHLILRHNAFDEKANSLTNGESEKKTQPSFKIRSRSKDEDFADQKLSEYSRIMKVAKRKRQANKDQLHKMEIHKVLQRKEMAKAVRKKKKKLESMRRSMSKQMMADYNRGKIIKMKSIKNPFLHGEEMMNTSNSIYQLSPALSQLAKIRFPNLRVKQDRSFEKSGFLDKPSYKKVMKKHKEMTSRNNHMYLYSRRSQSGSK